MTCIAPTRTCSHPGACFCQLMLWECWIWDKKTTPSYQLPYSVCFSRFWFSQAQTDGGGRLYEVMRRNDSVLQSWGSADPPLRREGWCLDSGLHPLPDVRTRTAIPNQQHAGAGQLHSGGWIHAAERGALQPEDKQYYQKVNSCSGLGGKPCPSTDYDFEVML